MNRARIFELATPRFGTLLVLAANRREAREIGKRYDAEFVRAHDTPQACSSCDSTPCCCGDAR